MLDVIRLFSQNPNWKKLAFVLEREETVPTCIQILKQRKTDQVALISSGKIARIFTESLQEESTRAVFNGETWSVDAVCLDPSEQIPFSLSEDDTALFFDCAERLPYFRSLAQQKPCHVLGATFDNVAAHFPVWEIFRESAQTIDIVAYRGKEVKCSLRWTRPESGVELSVVFPMYNVAQYLDKCVASVTEWKAPYVEFLFVDDGSPDNSGEIISRYAEKDPRIKLIKKPNGGCASARQKGLEEAKGQYVGFIDPDDFIDPSMYRKLFRAALGGHYDIAYAGYNEYYENTGTSRPVPDLINDSFPDGVTDPREINRLTTFLRIAIWRGIYSRELIERGKIHFYEDLRRFDDLPFQMEALAYAKSVISVPEYLYYYRLNRPGQDVSANDERLYVHFPIFKYLDATYKKIDEREHYQALQITKLFTHMYAIQKLLPKYYRPYCKQAKEDFRSLCSYKDSKRIFRLNLSRGHCRYFRYIYHGNILGLRLLCARANRKKAKELAELG